MKWQQCEIPLGVERRKGWWVDVGCSPRRSGLVWLARSTGVTFSAIQDKLPRNSILEGREKEIGRDQEQGESDIDDKAVRRYYLLNFSI